MCIHNADVKTVLDTVSENESRFSSRSESHGTVSPSPPEHDCGNPIRVILHDFDLHQKIYSEMGLFTTPRRY